MFAELFLLVLRHGSSRYGGFQTMNNKQNAYLYILGGLAGALVGLGITHTLIKSTENSETPLQLSPQKGLQIGMNTIGFARSILDLFKKA